MTKPTAVSRQFMNAPKRSARFQPHFHSHYTLRHDSRSNIQTSAAICLLVFCSF